MSRPRISHLPDLTPTSDTHLYIDMSGSQPLDSLLPAIAAEVDVLRSRAADLGRPLKLYVTGFSHEIGDDAPAIWVTGSFPVGDELVRIIRATPRVFGGTDLELVYDRINTSYDRSIRHNIIISDLECNVSHEALANHPRHLDYTWVEGVVPGEAWKERFIQLLAEANLPEPHTVS
ncbi:hypothetical protein ACFVU2_19125 [Leifsonia sp. NPDC058194]|uniref:hypothetical protein n=1 Tax=Leifsonia sp. NPDC058194 TaxID=3346374 RepID=UPI0036D8544D